MTYSEKLRDPRWQKKRLEIFNRDKWACIKCGDMETELHVHHIKYEGEPWEAPNELLVTLCAHCHIEVEDLKGECDIINFKEIKILKSNNWKNKNRIMFLSHGGVLSMSIYGKAGEYMIGFNIIADLREIKKIINHSLKNG